MGKLGDLIVRLRLKRDDYKNGLKEAEKDTQGFSAALTKIKGVGVAVWAAIGTSVIAFAKQLIASSQRIGDAWNRMTSQIKGGWDVFVQSVAAWNWDNFIGRIKEATIAAKALTNALDAEFEISNSIKLQKAAMAEELAELEVLARDQTKSYKVRAEAAQKYLDKVKPLYDQELMLAKKLEDAYLGKFLAGSGLEDTEQVRKDLRKFLVDVGKIPTLLDDLSAKSSAQRTIDRGANAFGSNYAKISEAYSVRNQMNTKLKDIQSEYQTDLVALFRAYNDMRGDEDAKPLVDAMIRAGEAAGAFNRETKRMQSALNTSLAQINRQGEDDLVQLESLARDQTKSYEERAEAAQKYLDKIKSIYDQELKLAQKLENVHLGKFLSVPGLEDTEQVRKDLRKFLVDIEKIPTLLDDLSAKSSAHKIINDGAITFESIPESKPDAHKIINDGAITFEGNDAKVNEAYSVIAQLQDKLKDIQSEYQTDLVALYQAYNEMRGDEDAKPLVDAMIRAGEAAETFEQETRQMQAALGDRTVEQLDKLTAPLEELSSITAPALQMNVPDIIPDDWLERNRDKIDAALAEAMRLQEVMMTINNSINEAIAGSLVGATQAIIDCIAGIEGADASQVLAALLQPFASTMTQLGEMLILEGIGIEAFKESLASLNPAVAIGAGVALVALGAALAAGISALGRTASGTTSATTSNAANSSSNRSFDTYEQEITVHVVGEIAGDKIVLAGQKTLNKWNR